MVISLDVSGYDPLFVPTSPTTMEHRCWLYTLRSRRRKPGVASVGPFLSWLTTTITRKVVYEDVPVFPSVQKGIQASIYRGIIGTLEERIWVFQRYVADQCGGSPGVAQNGEAGGREAPVTPCPPTSTPG